MYTSEKEEVNQEVYETIYDLTQILQGELLTIYGYTVGEGDSTFENDMYLYIFVDISTDMVEKKVMEEIESELMGEEYLKSS